MSQWQLLFYPRIFVKDVNAIGKLLFLIIMFYDLNQGNALQQLVLVLHAIPLYDIYYVYAFYCVSCKIC